MKPKAEIVRNELHRKILEDREENGCSMCEDCGRKYGNYEMENGLIDYCPNCCKCFEGDCKYRGCGCGEDDEGESK